MFSIVGRRQRLAARGDDEVARAIDEAEPRRPSTRRRRRCAASRPPPAPRASPPHCPSSSSKTCSPRMRISPDSASFSSHPGATVPTSPGRGKRLALAGDDGAGLLGLAVDLADVHAPDLPQRHRLGRQRRTPADDEAERVEPQLVEEGAEGGGAREGVDHAAGDRRARPSQRARALAAARPHRERRRRARLGRLEFCTATSACDGELLQVPRHREEHRRRDLEDASARGPPRPRRSAAPARDSSGSVTATSRPSTWQSGR